MKKALALSMAAVMALSSAVCVYAEGRDEAELRTMLSRVKDRIEIPAELEKFDYRVSTYAPKEEYTFTWATPDNAEEYKSMSCTICSTVITDFSRSDIGGYVSGNNKAALAELSVQQLYDNALAALKQLNPSVYKSISVDKGSFSAALRGNLASFRIVRTKNGIPVDNDSGRIWLDKNTGELARFELNWHANASFRSSNSIISEEKAKDKYQDMIAIRPQYEIYFDGDNRAYASRIVYSQDDWGEINAFTGNKSDFVADGYYDGEVSEDAAEAAPEAGVNGGFTPQELAELNKELPYSNEKAVIQLMESNEYMSYSDELGLSYSRLYKTEFNDDDIYVYSASFDTNSKDEDSEPKYTSHYESININVNAETGELMSYDYYNSDKITQTRDFDMEKMTALATNIVEKFAEKKQGEYEFASANPSTYTDKVGNIFYYGGNFRWQRMANGLAVNGDTINVSFSADGVMTSYNINYSNVEFASPETILTEDEIMEKFWENNDLDLYYLARVYDKKTKTVLVYGTDATIYCDAFTGEPIYGYYQSQNNNAAAISDKALREKAEILEAHGLAVTDGMDEADDSVSAGVYARVLNRICTMGLYSQYESMPLSMGKYDEEKSITVGDAMIMFTAAECGTAVPELKGIFKSPYSDVKDSDSNVGYYAIANALLGGKDDVLGAADSFTYADMIELVYNYLA